MQVEVSGGRGKPSTVVDKDESLEKVTSFTILNSVPIVPRNEMVN